MTWRANATHLVWTGKPALDRSPTFRTTRHLKTALADNDPLTAFNPFGDGSHTNPATLEAIRASRRSQVNSDIRVISAVADGPLFDMPMGTVRLAIGAEQRNETLQHRLAESEYASFGRQVSSAFAEISMPLVGDADEPRSPPRVELSLAGRYEKYSDFGNTFNPKVGVAMDSIAVAQVAHQLGHLIQGSQAARSV